MKYAGVFAVAARKFLGIARYLNSSV